MADKEYIEREAVEKAIRNYCKGAVEDGEMMLDTVDTSAYLIGAIGYIPTADVVEVRHGEWAIKTDDYDCEYIMCSCCREEFYPVDEDTVDITPNYCPNCGAKMDGKGEGE